jgi:5-deoxy-D-glucuronate isomerase
MNNLHDINFISNDEICKIRIRYVEKYGTWGSYPGHSNNVSDSNHSSYTYETFFYHIHNRLF